MALVVPTLAAGLAMSPIGQVPRQARAAPVSMLDDGSWRLQEDWALEDALRQTTVGAGEHRVTFFSAMIDGGVPSLTSRTVAQLKERVQCNSLRVYFRTFGFSRFFDFSPKLFPGIFDEKSKNHHKSRFSHYLASCLKFRSNSIVFW